MISITLKAVSSSREDPYDVVFTIEDGFFTVYCNCRAGTFGQLCKHKYGLLLGFDDMLFDPSDEDQIEKLNTVTDWAKRSEFSDYIIHMNEMEEIAKEAKKAFVASKKAFAAAMKNGIEFNM